MEAYPIIAETSQALGLPMTVTLALVIIATVVVAAIVLRDHRRRIEELEKDNADLAAEVSSLRKDMVAEAAARTAELAPLYTKINDIAVDVSYIKGRMEKEGK